VIPGVGGVSDAMIRCAQKHIDEATVKIADYERPAQLFWSILYPLLREIKNAVKASKYMTPNEKASFRGIIEAEEYCHEKIDEIYNSTVEAVHHYLIKSSSVNCFYCFHFKSSHNRFVVEISRYCKSKMFNIGGISRVGYAIANPSGIAPKWLKLNIKPIGVDMELPIYVQIHAIERMIERIGVTFYPESAAYRCIWQSVNKAIINSHGRDETNGRFLLECYFSGCKIGYFVCQVVNNAICITTFLFLTMDGTPEGDKFQSRLRVGRLDKQYLGLDNLDAFLNSDLQSDSRLVELMHKCGCGHIFELKSRVTYYRESVKIADEMRRYLKMKPKPMMK
jgi:hypothetical protein